MSLLILMDGELCMRIRWHQSLQSYMYKVKVRQLDCDKGINSWNSVMKLTLDQETRYKKFKRLRCVASKKDRRTSLVSPNQSRRKGVVS